MSPAAFSETFLEAVKVQTAAQVAAHRAATAATEPQLRVEQPPVLWRVEGTGQSFRDCDTCPELVVLPAGEFTMGSPGGERYRAAEPLRRVTIEKPFAVGKFEVSFAEWDACVAGGGCGAYSPEDQGWGRGTRPVIDVSWTDAKAYLTWLSAKTGKPYRLLSEAEWEYAARAGTSTAFSFGAVLGSAQANIDASGEGGESRMRTLPAGSFPANAFGLHDMHGNAWEWVEDCWNDEVNENAPADGSAWLTGSCTGRVMRGGSWEDYSGEARAAARVGNGIADHYWSDGFRVARDL